MVPGDFDWLYYSGRYSDAPSDKEGAEKHYLEHREREHKPKYYLSVGAIFKNEAHILEEWIQHYLAEGVDHFYLIDNGSTDNFMEILNRYTDKVTLYSDDTRYRQDERYAQHVFPQRLDSH